MLDWFKEHSPFLTFVYQVIVVLLLLWIVACIKHADPSWELGKIIELMRGR